MSDPHEPVLGESFLSTTQQVGAMNVFARVLPLWAKRHGKTVAFRFLGRLDGQLEIDLTLPDGCTEKDAESVVELLKKAQRVYDLELLVSEMRNVGTKAETIQQLVVEAETLVTEIYGEQTE